jgi:hypothetical protein
MEGWQIGLAAVAVFFVLRSSWKAYVHPAHTLGRQAANMDWVVDGMVAGVGFEPTTLKL